MKTKKISHIATGLSGYIDVEIISEDKDEIVISTNRLEHTLTRHRAVRLVEALDKALEITMI